MGLLGGLLDLALPVVMGRFIDSLWGPTSSGESVTYLAFLAVLMVVSAILMTVGDYSLGLIAEETVFGLRTRLVQRAFRQPIGWYQKVSPGDLSSRLTNDTEKLRAAINNGPIEIFLNAALLLGTVSVMIWLSPLLVLVVIVIAVIGLAESVR
ncbi:ABC transporter transmembrane domain-containing protein [Corynebacterium yudongzhengii]|uniref:ABC transporter transmembrane domain-containing protein n=1 Tax=Corynebacterium yudongzhengii TaxID=2080740 RepID=UPI001304E0E5